MITKTLELIKQIPGFKIGAFFHLSPSGDIRPIKSDNSLGPKLGIPYDSEFFKKIELITVKAGNYILTKPDGSNSTKHVYYIGTDIHVKKVPGLKITVKNLTINQITNLHYDCLSPATKYSFFNSKGIISHDIIEINPQLYKMRQSLGLVDTVENLRARKSAIELDILNEH